VGLAEPRPEGGHGLDVGLEFVLEQVAQVRVLIPDLQEQQRQADDERRVQVRPRNGTPARLQ